MSGHSLHSFEEVHYDTYEYYNLTDYRAGKGRRRNTGQNYRQQRGGGRGRRVAEALFNSELKRKRLRASHQIRAGSAGAVAPLNMMEGTVQPPARFPDWNARG
ncbi:nuclear protein 1b [Narcine bancroftii]|uniref:nuclear protein 1b n=1 Tax=Narcine bancroftii TaxID=1343680 RepID=UPI0038318508